MPAATHVIKDRSDGKEERYARAKKKVEGVVEPKFQERRLSQVAKLHSIPRPASKRVPPL